jgi:hypothetical protein
MSNVILADRPGKVEEGTALSNPPLAPAPSAPAVELSPRPDSVQNSRIANQSRASTPPLSAKERHEKESIYGIMYYIVNPSGQTLDEHTRGRQLVENYINFSMYNETPDPLMHLVYFMDRISITPIKLALDNCKLTVQDFSWETKSRVKWPLTPTSFVFECLDGDVPHTYEEMRLTDWLHTSRWKLSYDPTNTAYIQENAPSLDFTRLAEQNSKPSSFYKRPYYTSVEVFGSKEAQRTYLERLQNLLRDKVGKPPLPAKEDPVENLKSTDMRNLLRAPSDIFVEL